MVFKWFLNGFLNGRVFVWLRVTSLTSEYFFCKFGLDTAENKPFEVSWRFWVLSGSVGGMVSLLTKQTAKSFLTFLGLKWQCQGAWLQRRAPVIIFELYPPYDRPHTSDSLRASNDHMDILSPRLATFPSPPFGGNVWYQAAAGSLFRKSVLPFNLTGIQASYAQPGAIYERNTPWHCIEYDQVSLSSWFSSVYAR